MTQDKDLIPVDIDLMRKLRKTNNEGYHRMMRVYKKWRDKQRTQDKREMRNQCNKIWRFKNPDKVERYNMLKNKPKRKHILRQYLLYTDKEKSDVKLNIFVDVNSDWDISFTT